MEAREEEEEEEEEEEILTSDEEKESWEDDMTISELEEGRICDNCVVELGETMGLEMLVFAEFDGGVPLGPFTVFSLQDKSRENASIAE